jgi:hypothetical protein
METIKNYFKIKQRHIDYWNQKRKLFKKMKEYYINNWDISNSIFNFPFLTLIEYVEHGNMDCFDWTYNKATKEAYKKIMECYNYYKIERVELEKHIENYLKLWRNEHTVTYTPNVDFPSVMNYDSVTTPQGETYFKLLHKVEEELKKKDNLYLTQLINVRYFL